MQSESLFEEEHQEKMHFGSFLLFVPWFFHFYSLAVL